MGEKKSLSGKQMVAVRALLTNPSIEQAAQVAAVSPSSIYRWLDNPEFQAALTAGQSEAIGGVTRNLVALSTSAIQVVQDVLDSPIGKSSSKLRAAEIVLGNMLRLVELHDHARRLAALEAVQNENR